MQEIERKFLVTSNDFVQESFAKFYIAQGYLNSCPERNVRIRVKDNKGFITVKGVGDESGVKRFEWDKEIDCNEAKKLLELCEKTIIEKTRYEVQCGKHVFEIDVFEGANEGLVIAEIELEEEQAFFEKPHWLGEEVTGKIQYYNAYLSRNPYKK